MRVINTLLMGVHLVPIIQYSIFSFKICLNLIYKKCKKKKNINYLENERNFCIIYFLIRQKNYYLIVKLLFGYTHCF